VPSILIAGSTIRSSKEKADHSILGVQLFRKRLRLPSPFSAITSSRLERTALAAALCFSLCLLIPGLPVVSQKAIHSLVILLILFYAALCQKRARRLELLVLRVEKLKEKERQNFRRADAELHRLKTTFEEACRITLARRSERTAEAFVGKSQSSCL
jgi:type VI protein secretion system component VasK